MDRQTEPPSPPINQKALLKPSPVDTSLHSSGGEFACNNVTCYERNDCTARYTPGRCCPEYDNCPPLGKKVDLVIPWLRINRVISLPENTKADHGENSSDSTDEEADHGALTTRPPQSSTPNSAVSNDNPLGIKIKEITKPEEIRITDEKPKFKVATTTTTAAPATSPTATTSTTTPPPSSSSSSSSSSSPMDTTSDYYSSTRATVSKSSEEAQQGHFNQTDDPFELDEEFAQDYFNDTDTNKNVREASGNGTIPEETAEEEGEEEEEEEEQNNYSERINWTASSTSTPESIVAMNERLDDDRKDIKQVIIVDHNGASKPITIIGSSSLQFGGSNPDEDFNPYELPIHASSTAHIPPFIDDFPPEESGSGHSTPPSPAPRSNETTTESDQLAQGSTKREVYVPIMEGSAMPAEDETGIDYERYNFTETTYPLFNSSELTSAEDDHETYSFNSSTTWQPEDSPRISHETTVGDRTPFQNDELTNPEYPNIPEDLTIHGEQDSHPEDQLFVHSSPATPALSENYADAEKRSPGEPHLIPEWERRNETEKENFEEENMEDEEEEGEHGKKDDSSEETNFVDGGSGKSAEPTTTSPFRFDFGDINLQDDMMEENSTEERRISPSPKDDVESLKMRQDAESASERMSATATTERKRGDEENALEQHNYHSQNETVAGEGSSAVEDSATRSSYKDNIEEGVQMWDRY